MRIKIDPNNPKSVAAITAALHAVNGTATAHTFTSAEEMARLATIAEEWVAQVLLVLSERPGARMTCESGDKVANSYRYSRVGTSVTLERGSSKTWYLVNCCSITLWNDAGKFRLYLTPEQDAAGFAADFSLLAASL